MSTENIYEAVIRICKRRLPYPGGTHLDIGAGRGELIRKLGEAISPKSFACDFHTDRFAAGNMPCAKVNLNLEPLPYPDAGFELVTCSEVVEHLENYRALLREAYRVAKPGGLLIVTTPNVLNVNSRVRYLWSGFANLFGPLPVRNDKLYSTGGHISPIAYFYLAHALLDAGFGKLELDIDKVQRTSVFWLVLLLPFMLMGWFRFMARERRRFKTITVENAPLVKSHFSWRLLVGRTIVVSAMKPGKTDPAIALDGQAAACA
jgi:SAM-dependent methyltransferase